MSGIIGPITPGKIAFAIGSIGVGALVGGTWAHAEDKDVAKGAIYGGLAAAAGVALVAGGAYAWNRFQAGRAAAAGASQLGTSLSHVFTPTATHAATSTLPSATSLFHLPAPSTLFQAATRPLAVTVPAIARTPVLPVAASSGNTMLNALRMFL